MSTLHARLLSSAAILAALAAAPSGVWATGGGGGGGGAGGGGPVRLGTTIVEGPITAINPAAGTITVAGALVKVPADGTATIHTPTATNLTLADLGNAAADLPAGSLPGGGIMGAHAVVQGTSG